MPRKKKTPSVPVRGSESEFSSELESLIERAGREAAGRPLGEVLRAESGSLLSRLIGRIVQIALDEEMATHLGYDRYERRPERDDPQAPPNYRNGSYTRHLQTSHGTTAVRMPRDREASFEPSIIPSHTSITQDVEERVVSMYTAGMTTRDIEDHLRQIYHIDANPMMISRLTARLDDELRQWRNRPLEAVYPIVFIDAMRVHVRQPQGVAPTPIYNVCGYGEGGQMSILGVFLPEEGQTGESASFWHQICVELERRGVKDVLILCGDGLAGMEQAVQAVWPRARFSPCVVHLIRNATRSLNHTQRGKFCAALRHVYEAPTWELAQEEFLRLEQVWQESAPEAVAVWRVALPRLEYLWRYGPPLRKVVYTTNPIENLNRRVRKTFKQRASMPNRESALRLASLVLRKIDTQNAASARTRPEWRRIVAELHIHFGERLPQGWGTRLLD